MVPEGSHFTAFTPLYSQRISQSHWDIFFASHHVKRERGQPTPFISQIFFDVVSKTTTMF